MKLSLFLCCAIISLACCSTSFCSQDMSSSKKSFTTTRTLKSAYSKKTSAQSKAQARHEAAVKFVLATEEQKTVEAQKKEQAWKDAIAKVEAKKVEQKQAITERAAKNQAQALRVLERGRARKPYDRTTPVSAMPPHTHIVRTVLAGYDGTTYEATKYITCWNCPCYR